MEEISDKINGNKQWNPKPGYFRYVPKCMIEQSRSDLIIHEDPVRISNYIINAFYTYRATVNRGFYAPHVFVDGVYEWPSNAHFDWADIDAVTTFGDAISFRDELNKLFKYQINDLSDVSVAFSDLWQIASLQKYASGIRCALIQFEHGRINREEMDHGLMEYLNSLDACFNPDM